MSRPLICNDRWTYHVWQNCRVKRPVNSRIMFVTGCMFCGIIESIKPGLSWEECIKRARPDL